MMEQRIKNKKEQAFNPSFTSKQSILPLMSSRMEPPEDPSEALASAELNYNYYSYYSLMDPSEAPIAQPVFNVSTKEENALCDLLNISPSQISYLTLSCDASAPSGSKFSEDPCNSEYVICNSNGEITTIKRIPIYGSLPSSIGNFAALQYLDLSSSKLTGPIPSSIGDLTNLEGLNLASNQLTGPIPFSIGTLTNLIELSLYKNQLTGSIPSSIGDLINLKYLYLASNQLTGPIPSSIGN